MAITSRSSILTNMASGKGFSHFFYGKSNAGVTAANANSGSITLEPFPGNISTYMSTLYGLPLPAGLPNELFITSLSFSAANVRFGGFLARFYLMGTVDFTATGDRFTADANVTYPLTRKVYGAATQTISLTPVIALTTAMTGTAAQFIVKTAAAGTGYVNQAGSNVVGTKTFIYPSATTALQSTYIIRLEEGDSAVQSIAAINVTTASTAGVGAVYGVEYLCPGANTQSYAGGSIIDTVSGCLLMTDLAPAVPTAGTLTSYLMWCTAGSSNAYSSCHLTAVLNA